MTTATVLFFMFSLICLVGNVDNAFVETKLIRFTKYLDFEGLNCPTNEILFNDSASRDISQCAWKCSRIPSCVGVFRFHGNNKCVGCKTQFLQENSLYTLDETSYFRRQSKYFIKTFRKMYIGSKIVIVLNLLSEVSFVSTNIVICTHFDK